jgi:lipid II:glycine glycyltransferase (peptidoglycan interpeptide bridge formation enzyme)
MSELTVEVDAATSSDWSRWLDLFEDANIYQTWSYGELRWGQKKLSHLVLKRGDHVVAMAQLRIIRPARMRCGIAYLRWGPLCQVKGEELNPVVVERMAAAMREEYVRKRGLFLRILPPAFLGTPQAAAFEAAFAAYDRESFGPTDSYRTFALDLEPSLEVLRKNLDQKWRNCLNRAEKNGLTMVQGSGPEEFHQFIRIYDEMWARKQFEEGSDVREFQQLQEDLPERHRMKVLLCKHEGVAAAGLVATAMGNSAIYLLGATSDIGMKLKGSYLLHWALIKELKELGIRYYNLGGINPEKNPGVYHFKAGFSGRDVLYMPPVVSCGSVLSGAFARASTLARGKLRHSLNKILRRNTRPPATLRPGHL